MCPTTGKLEHEAVSPPWTTSRTGDPSKGLTQSHCREVVSQQTSVKEHEQLRPKEEQIR